MKISSPEEENIVKDVRNFFRLEKEKDNTTIKFIRNLFRLKKALIERLRKTYFRKT